MKMQFIRDSTQIRFLQSQWPCRKSIARTANRSRANHWRKSRAAEKRLSSKKGWSWGVGGHDLWPVTNKMETQGLWADGDWNEPHVEGKGARAWWIHHHLSKAAGPGRARAETESTAKTQGTEQGLWLIRRGPWLSPEASVQWSSAANELKEGKILQNGNEWVYQPGRCPLLQEIKKSNTAPKCSLHRIQHPPQWHFQCRFETQHRPNTWHKQKRVYL